MSSATETVTIPDIQYTDCFIGGRWVPASRGKTFPTINPATELKTVTMALN
jgi:acyl-CoA reductase-like NAD-dependent aldehyde dehydrogenase